MEKEGFVYLLDSLLDQGVNVDTLSTDRHCQIRKLMRVEPRYKKIKHTVDPWHLIKGIRKKLNAASKKKDCALIGKYSCIKISGMIR